MISKSVSLTVMGIGKDKNRKSVAHDTNAKIMLQASEHKIPFKGTCIIL